MRSPTNTIATLLTLMLAALALPWPAAAAPPALLPLQGYLTDESDVALDGSYKLEFTLYDDALTGNSLYATSSAVNVAHGNFTVYLGDQDALDLQTLQQNDSVWLEIKIVQSCGTDTTCNTGTLLNRTLAPRLQFGTTAFAASAAYCGRAESFAGKLPTDFAGSDQTCGGAQTVTGIDPAGALVCADVDAYTKAQADAAFMPAAITGQVAADGAQHVIVSTGSLSTYEVTAKAACCGKGATLHAIVTSAYGEPSLSHPGITKTTSYYNSSGFQLDVGVTLNSLNAWDIWLKSSADFTSSTKINYVAREIQ